MQRLVFRTLLMTFVVAVGTTSASLADQKEEAEKLFRAAENFFDSGQYEQAADNFERAYETLPLPAIAFSAAQAYRLQYFKNRQNAFLKRSVELYRRYIDEQKEGGRIADAVSILAELEPILARAEQAGAVAKVVREEKTGIVVTSQIKGAKATVNESEPAAMPLAVSIKPGKHTVMVVAPGYAPLSKTVDVVQGQVLAVEGALIPLPVALSVNARDGSKVTVDGTVVGTTPLLKPVSLEAGAHFVAVTQRGFKPYSKRFLGGRGDSMTVDAELSRTRQRKVSYAFLGASATLGVAAALAAAGALGANSKAKELDDLRTTRALTREEADDYNTHLDDRSRANTAGLAFLGTGLAVGAVGALLFFLDDPTPDRPPETNPALAPSVSADGAGLVLSGSF